LDLLGFIDAHYPDWLPLFEISNVIYVLIFQNISWSEVLNWKLNLILPGDFFIN